MSGTSYVVKSAQVVINPETNLYALLMMPEDGDPFLVVMKPSVALQMARDIQTPKEVGLRPLN